VAGRLDGVYWLIGPGSASLAQGCHCALLLQGWAWHIMVAARLQLVLLAPVFTHKSIKPIFCGVVKAIT